MARPWVVLLAAAVAAGCSDAAPVTLTSLSLQELDGCPLGTPSRLSLRATGDFTPRIQELSLEGPTTLDDFPVDARFLAIEAQAGERRTGAVVALAGRDQVRDVLMLPLGESCPLGDPLAALPRGGAVAALDDGALLVVGGRDRDGSVRSSAVLLSAGARLVEQVPGGMLLRREGATASVSGLSVLVVGGAADDRSTAHDLFEVYDRVSGRFDRARVERASGPRRDHAAYTLPDGRVLIAGGRAAPDTEPLASAERIDPATGAVEVTGALQHARRAPTDAEPRARRLQLLGLDDGTVLAVGGLDRDGAPVDAIERYDAERGRFEVVPDAEVSGDEVAAAALPGARVALLSCTAPVDCATCGSPAECEGCGAAACELTMIAFGEGEVRCDVLALRAGDAVASAFFPPADALAEPLEQVRLLALEDGTLLVTARAVARVSMERTALHVDPSSGEVRGVDASRVPERLIALADGSVAELDASGASLRRERVGTPFDDPSPDPVGEGEVALDVASHWSRHGTALRAEIDGARLDLPLWRFAHARVSLRLGCDAERDAGCEARGALLVVPEGALARRVELTPTSLSVGDCTLERTPDADLEVEWDRGTLVLRAAEGSRRCPLSDVADHVSFGVWLLRGVSLEGLHLQRL